MILQLKYYYTFLSILMCLPSVKPQVSNSTSSWIMPAIINGSDLLDLIVQLQNFEDALSATTRRPVTTTVTESTIHPEVLQRNLDAMQRNAGHLFGLNITQKDEELNLVVPEAQLNTTIDSEITTEANITSTTTTDSTIITTDTTIVTDNTTTILQFGVSDVTMATVADPDVPETAVSTASTATLTSEKSSALPVALEGFEPTRLEGTLVLVESFNTSKPLFPLSAENYSLVILGSNPVDSIRPQKSSRSLCNETEMTGYALVTCNLTEVPTRKGSAFMLPPGYVGRPVMGGGYGGPPAVGAGMHSPYMPNRMIQAPAVSPWLGYGEGGYMNNGYMGEGSGGYMNRGYAGPPAPYAPAPSYAPVNPSMPAGGYMPPASSGMPMRGGNGYMGGGGYGGYGMHGASPSMGNYPGNSYQGSSGYQGSGGYQGGGYQGSWEPVPPVQYGSRTMEPMSVAPVYNYGGYMGQGAGGWYPYK